MPSSSRRRCRSSCTKGADLKIAFQNEAAGIITDGRVATGLPVLEAFPASPDRPLYHALERVYETGGDSAEPSTPLYILNGRRRPRGAALRLILQPLRDDARGGGRRHRGRLRDHRTGARPAAAREERGQVPGHLRAGRGVDLGRGPLGGEGAARQPARDPRRGAPTALEQNPSLIAQAMALLRSGTSILPRCGCSARRAPRIYRLFPRPDRPGDIARAPRQDCSRSPPASGSSSARRRCES